MTYSSSDTLAYRWAQKVQRGDGCWLWTAFTDRYGYGRIQLHGIPVLAHRVAYELHVGPIPDGLVIDHLCRNPSCVNPAHLEPVTQAENMRRGLVREVWSKRCAAITHCPQGHEYTSENTRRYNGKRQCVACSAERTRRRRAAA